MGSITGQIVITKAGTEIIVDSTAPTNPEINALWLDTNNDKNVLKKWDGTEWQPVGDPSQDIEEALNEFKVNYYTKEESDKRVETLIGESTITKSDGSTVNMKEALNAVIDTATEHTQKLTSIDSDISDINDNLTNNYSTTTQMNSAITQKANEITTTVSATYTTKEEFTAVETIATQTADKFNWLVKSGTSATDFTLTDRTATLISEYINLNGLVTFSGLESDTQNKITTAQSTANMANNKAQDIIDNIYTAGTTTIDGGKITTGSIKAAQINVDDLFAQNITAKGTITGATLKGANLESDVGKIADFEITQDGFVRELDWQGGYYEAPYKNWCEISSKAGGSIDKGAGTGTFSFTCPSFRQGYYTKSSLDPDDKDVTKITSFETHMFGMRTDYFEAKHVNSDFISIAKESESLPEGYLYTHYDLGNQWNPWENLFVKNINVVKTLKSGSGNIQAGGDVIAGLGTSNQVSLQTLNTNKANKQWTKILDTGYIGHSTYETKGLSSALSNFSELLFVPCWWSNPGPTAILPVSHFKTLYSNANRLMLTANASTYYIQCYYVSDTVVAVNCTQLTTPQMKLVIYAR